MFNKKSPGIKFGLNYPVNYTSFIAISKSLVGGYEIVLETGKVPQRSETLTPTKMHFVYTTMDLESRCMQLRAQTSFISLSVTECACVVPSVKLSKEYEINNTTESGGRFPYGKVVFM